MRLEHIPIVVWLFTSAVTAGLGWPVVRFLPLWASIPLMIIIALLATMAGVFGVVAAIPGDGGTLKRTNTLYSAMLGAVLVSPAAITLWLFRSLS